QSRRRFLQAGVGFSVLVLLAGCGLIAPGRKVAHIGILWDQFPQPEADAFRTGMGEQGYVEGERYTIDAQLAQDGPERYPEIAAAYVPGPMDVIVAAGTAAVRPAKAATSTIPIVMAFCSDPVRAGLIESLAHPGGNVTGLTDLTVELSPKRLELL